MTASLTEVGMYFGWDKKKTYAFFVCSHIINMINDRNFLFPVIVSDLVVDKVPASWFAIEADYQKKGDQQNSADETWW